MTASSNTPHFRCKDAACAHEFDAEHAAGGCEKCGGSVAFVNYLELSGEGNLSKPHRMQGSGDAFRHA